MNTLFRDQLLAAAEQAAYPSERVLDPVSGEESLDAEAVADLTRLFDLFGVTLLDPNDADFDKVLNTACTLATEVAGHVQSLSAVSGAVAALESAGDWHPDYSAYVSALWQGDREAVARCAAQLQIRAGIRNGSQPLDAGPLG